MCANKMWGIPQIMPTNPICIGSTVDITVKQEMIVVSIMAYHNMLIILQNEQGCLPHEYQTMLEHIQSPQEQFQFN